MGTTDRTPGPCTPVDVGILVGGRGRRLGGVDKASLRLPNGESLLDRAIATWLPQAQRVFVLGRAEQERHIAPPACLLEDAADRDGQAIGPLGGLLRLLEASTAPWVFLLACDQPLVDADVLSRLRQSAALQPHDAVMVPDVLGRLQPTAALYRRDTLPFWRNAMRRGAFGLQRGILALDAVRVHFDGMAARKFLNINTPDDRRLWLSMISTAVPQGLEQLHKITSR